MTNRQAQKVPWCESDHRRRARHASQGPLRHSGARPQDRLCRQALGGCRPRRRDGCDVRRHARDPRRDRRRARTGEDSARQRAKSRRVHPGELRERQVALHGDGESAPREQRCRLARAPASRLAREACLAQGQERPPAPISHGGAEVARGGDLRRVRAMGPGEQAGRADSTPLRR